MSLAFKAEETIARPVDDVWTALTDWANASRWMRGIDWIRANGDTAAGTELTFHARGKERSSSIAQCEPGRLLVLRSVQGAVTADYTYRLEQVDAGRTKVALVAECRSDGLKWRLLFPLIRIAIKHVDGGQLRDLRQHLEAAQS